VSVNGGSAASYVYDSLNRRVKTTPTDYAVNRQHQNANGRFMQPDAIAGSIGNPQSLNRYSYSLNDPVNLVDPEGLFPNIAGAITSALTGFSLTHQVSAGGWTVEIVPIPAGFLGGPIGGRDFAQERSLPIGNIWYRVGMAATKVCDDKLAKVFGGPGAVVGTTHDPRSLGIFKNPGGAPVPRNPGHGPAPYNHPDPTNPDRGGIIHIYGNAQGTATTAGLYTPSGGTIGRMQTSPYGNTQIRVSYAGGLSITFVHVTASNIKDTNSMGSVRISNIGGPVGANNPGYVHTHIVFFKNGLGLIPERYTA
jgi:RHS repeat-associated protein